MRSYLKIFLFTALFLNLALAQNPPPTEDVLSTGEVAQPPPTTPDPQLPPDQQPPPLPSNELGEPTGFVIKKNSFSYDGGEGRDPFKVYREVPVISGTNPDGSNGGTKNDNPMPSEKSIRTALVPGDIIVQGILYKKSDPIALVRVRDVKGLNKLKVNSPIGRNEGKVIEIQKDRIVIEQVKDFDGQKFTEKITLKVREKKN